MRLLLKHAHLIVDGNKEYLDGAILINDEHIEDVFPNSNKIKITGVKTINVKGMIIMPGFFDTHSHGIEGVDYLDCNNNDLNNASYAYAKKGTTAFYSTIYTSVKMINAMHNFNNLNTDYARCLGIHLEGPFVSKDKLGVINSKDIVKASSSNIAKIISLNSHIKQMTIAPEIENANEVINCLRKHNIKVMLGHSNAININNIYYDGFTHLYNAMSNFNHRNSGLVNEAFNNTDKYVELIGDGIHISKDVLKTSLKLLRRDRIMLVSDSTLACGLKDGTYYFNGEKCLKEGMSFKRNKDNQLSGSVSCIGDEIKVMKEIGASYTDILLMSSLNAYRFYGLDNLYGSLRKGKYADIVLLDEDLNVLCTFVRGKMIYA